MARILISAGEASGDIHAAAVTRELKNIAPDTEVFGMGGDCLREAGQSNGRKKTGLSGGC